MSVYLTYEEMRLWRSSTEKITLEEFAVRLGKAVNHAKETNDLYDQIKYTEAHPVIVEPVQVAVKEPVVEQQKQNVETMIEDISFKKKLTDREEAVFEYFRNNSGRAVFVKELARILNLPNDYVYKYIKNLRSKLEKNVLVNCDDGGYILEL